MGMKLKNEWSLKLEKGLKNFGSKHEETAKLGPQRIMVKCSKVG